MGVNQGSSACFLKMVMPRMRKYLVVKNMELFWKELNVMRDNVLKVVMCETYMLIFVCASGFRWIFIRVWFKP